MNISLEQYHKYYTNNYFRKREIDANSKAYLVKKVTTKKVNTQFSAITHSIMSNISDLLIIKRLTINSLLFKTTVISNLYSLIDKNIKNSSPFCLDSPIEHGHFVFISFDISESSCSYIVEVFSSESEIFKQTRINNNIEILKYLQERINYLHKLRVNEKLETDFNNYVDVDDYKRFRDMVIPIIQRAARQIKKLKYPET